MSAVLTILAPAKVNLALEALGRRSDGYHEVRAVLQAVGLCDEVGLDPAAGLSLAVKPPGAAPVEGNLALDAAKALRDAAGVRAGARITLAKRIPAAAGLGGGSSDAAAVLLGLRRLWGISLPDEALAEVAASLGSDVPFFLRGGTALATGRGADLEALPPPVEAYAVLLLASDPPGPQAKTARLYGLLDAAHYSGGEATAEVARRLRAGEAVGAAEGNVFDAVAAQAHPGHDGRLRAFRDAGARNPCLAGAGPSLFALAGDAAEASAICERLTAQGYDACAAPVLSASEPFA
ncbi:MAG: 4-(cytidine 5'-diphospho)-2-C-methyl-D-erythritol kinase [Chloroflexota bacterium]|nr:4-(cytidine 5'-diphospho)-2-C-methyl-D-erythritol kinase [Chloroflexota bacterium]